MFVSWHTRIPVFYTGTAQLLNLSCVKHEYVAIWVPINQPSFVNRKLWESQHTLNNFLPVLWNINLHLLSCNYSSNNTLSVSLSLSLLKLPEKDKRRLFATGSQTLGIIWTWKNYCERLHVLYSRESCRWEKTETTFFVCRLHILSN